MEMMPKDIVITIFVWVDERKICSESDKERERRRAKIMWYNYK